ncbi:MAG: carbohydrate binding domain-containing protein [Oscillochloridaceae bacterium umkhey_bin13]
MMRTLRPWLVLTLLAALIAGTLGFRAVPLYAATLPVVDDFESPLLTGVAPNEIPVGWFTAQDGSTTVTFDRTTTPPAARPDGPEGNNVLTTSMNVAAFGVVIHAFTNEAANVWVTQDWSEYFGMSFWFYGQGTNTDLFIDVVDNRPADSTRDDAERYTVTFKDDFTGWRKLEFPFDDFVRKEIGNGAPSDGFTLTEIHGWAFGALGTGGQTRTWYLDQVEVYGIAPVRPLTVGFGNTAVGVIEGRAATVSVRLSKVHTETVTVRYATRDGSATAGRDYVAASGTLTFEPGVREQVFRVTTLDDNKWEGTETILLSLNDAQGAELGIARTGRIDIRDNETFDANLLEDFERDPDLFAGKGLTNLQSYEIAEGDPMALPGQTGFERVLLAEGSFKRVYLPTVLVQSQTDTVRSLQTVVSNQSAIALERTYATAQDWSEGVGLNFWLYGRNSGKDLTVTIRDNRAPDPGLEGWQLVWADEFDAPAGTPADPASWRPELGDGSVNGIPGWGNGELQYYTDDPENVAHDGQGNLAITVREAAADSGLICYYGPCQYTSARLLTQHKFEFGYGRVEARIKVPGGAGLWPAFWSLGNDINEVGWPQTGEIDMMEFVGRLPNEIFGTIHGPGYSGGQSFSGIYDFGEPVPGKYHTYTIDWDPNLIIWYVNGIEYHRATPSDVAPNPWVFDHPFFLLLNVAIGGNFGGAVGPDATFPATMLVDYVRVYAADDTAERFSATVKDDFTGWQRVSIPFDAFTRSANQPAGAPNDGLSLNEVWGFEMSMPAGATGPLMIDQLRLQQSCPDTVTVTSNADEDEGSLRAALTSVCRGGTVTFAPALAGQTITLASELVVSRDVTIDATAAAGLQLSGNDSSRILVIEAGSSVVVRNLTIRDGFGFQLGGAVIVNGQALLDRVIVEGSSTTGDGQFWQGGGGIYVGGTGTLTLRESTVRNNTTTAADGGGIYGFVGSLIIMERSSVINNTAGNVGGGMRILGDAQIENSTISGNTSTAWHGGAIFHTNGTALIYHSTIANNNSPEGTSGGVFVGTFTEANAQAELQGSVIAGNSGDQCFLAPFGSGAVSILSRGGNLASDATCALDGAGDKPSTDPLLGALADNGGPTLTHALGAGSPALDMAATATCPPIDQRGVSRPQGSGCDAGSFEREP